MRETIGAGGVDRVHDGRRRPLIAGRRAGSGPLELLLHGGPGLGFDYVRELAPLPTGSTSHLDAGAVIEEADGVLSP